MTQADPTAPSALVQVASTVTARLELVVGEAIEAWIAIDPATRELFESVRDFTRAGGKRLRPAFCSWAYVGAGGDADDQPVLDAGAALELLHAFALMHDDVMDGSVRRRGSSTVHHDYASRHEVNGWGGEPRRFGEGVAILAGDISYVLANQLMAGANHAATTIWNTLAIEVNVGQYLDLLGTARGAVDLDTARRISRYKSGLYTIERPLHLGAALACRIEELREPLTAFGHPLGEAFQLRDDMLGAFGDPAQTGKPVGDDLREGKPTPLLALARQAASANQRSVLDLVGAGDLTDAEIASVQQVLEATGARSELDDTIARLTQRSLDALAEIDLTPPASEAMRELAIYVGRRTC